ncbi:MAG: nucleoside-diphosphate kinase [Chitinivibrionales bacterium]|nr:nucleoside-diphosphate kinase [Chitinivibrionales bacterium]MBD3394363.1 nucleoside-diphosphate kinase [Chitinivibrionales bacterium]
MSRELQRTLAIIKPDAYSYRLIGAIIGEIESKSDLRIIGARALRLTREQARRFYAVHEGKPFYDKLIMFMTSGPIMVLALHGPDAITRWREIMGSTDPEEAKEGTIRSMFASDVTFNAVHGSDAPHTAAAELTFFFGDTDLIQPR